MTAATTTTRYVVEKRRGGDVFETEAETVRCEDFPALKAAWEDLAGKDYIDAHADAGELARGEVSELRHVYLDTGDEVTARRA